LLILIGTSADKQLPTIRSRCQTIRFRPLADDLVADILERRGLVADAGEARRLAGFAEGSVQRALELSDEELWSFRRQLLRTLAPGRYDSVALAQEIAAFVEAAGKEAPPRRTRLRRVAGFGLDFFRQALRKTAGLAPQGDEVLLEAVNLAGTSRDVVTLAALADRTLAALAHVDRNAHLPTLIDCWIDDLARIERSGQPLPALAE
jgi:DNA polymerase-3 subunit delta'